jgi:prepilin-type N-terminal cleavage/methylation domain-containing protein
MGKGAARRRVTFSRSIGDAIMVQRFNRGFTLIELLVVIAIIAVLISILLPALSLAKETASVAYCVNNMRTLSMTAVQYMDDSDDLVLPWHMGFQLGAQYASEYIFGGYRSELDNPEYQNSDTYLYPTEMRPFNKYIAPGAEGRSPIKSYVCPSDKTWKTPLLGSSGGGLPAPDAYTSWMVNGNSYAINWYWAEGPPWNGARPGYEIGNMTAGGRELLKKKVGGSASRWVVFCEGAMNSFMYDARPLGGPGTSPLQTLGMGWHMKRSTFAMAYLDGHAAYSFVDTRYTGGPNHQTWADPGTLRGW